MRIHHNHLGPRGVSEATLRAGVGLIGLAVTMLALLAAHLGGSVP